MRLLFYFLLYAESAKASLSAAGNVYTERAPITATAAFVAVVALFF